MKRTKKQVENIKNGCKKRNKDLIINAQKKRHLKVKINQAILEKIKKSVGIEKAKDWVERLETLTEQASLEQLLKEIQN